MCMGVERRQKEMRSEATRRAFLVPHIVTVLEMHTSCHLLLLILDRNPGPSMLSSAVTPTSPTAGVPTLTVIGSPLSPAVMAPLSPAIGAL